MNWKIASALSALSLAAVATQANAADLAARPYTKAPPMVAAIYDWSGFYVGANGGLGSSPKGWGITKFPRATVVPPLPESCHDAAGGGGGGRICFRWERGRWVVGLATHGGWGG